MRKVAFQLVLAVAALALALPMLAKSASTDVKGKSTTLDVTSSIMFGGTMVPPGKYKIVFDTDKATIMNGNKTVATFPGHWEDRKQKAQGTGFQSTGNKVDEIMVGGDTNVFVLGS
jgi:hypothetical protein